MKDNDIVKQAGEIALQTEIMVKYAHYLLRNDELKQARFLEVKKLEIKARKLFRKLRDEEHHSNSDC